MEENFQQLFNCCKGNPEYLGNSIQGFYLFYCAAKNKDFRKQLTSMLKWANELCADKVKSDRRFENYKNITSDLSESNKIINKFYDFFYDDFNIQEISK